MLFNGRLYAELKSVLNAKKLGNSDAQAAVRSARREGFPAHTIIFLDQEQGGRMLPEQKAYLYAWVDAVTAAGFRPGIYCSGIAAKDDGNIVTAADIRQNAGARRDRLLGDQRRLSSRALLLLSRQPAKPLRKRGPLRRGLAVRAVTAAQRCGWAVLELQPRWQLLSSGNRRRATIARGRGYRYNS